jgi:hypothetical protein
VGRCGAAVTRLEQIMAENAAVAGLKTVLGEIAAAEK